MGHAATQVNSGGQNRASPLPKNLPRPALKNPPKSGSLGSTGARKSHQNSCPIPARKTRKTRQTPLHQHLRFTRFPRNSRFPRFQILPLISNRSFRVFRRNRVLRSPTVRHFRSEFHSQGKYLRTPQGRDWHSCPSHARSTTKLASTEASKDSKLPNFAVPAKLSREFPCFAELHARR